MANRGWRRPRNRLGLELSCCGQRRLYCVYPVAHAATNASAHRVHVGLVAFLLYISATPFPRWKLVFFGLGVFWVYSLALLSIRRITEFWGIDPRTWRIVRSIGVEYIALVFLFDFAPKPFYGGVANRLMYLPFFVMAIAGPLLRLAAAAKRLAGSQRVAV